MTDPSEEELSKRGAALDARLRAARSQSKPEQGIGGFRRSDGTALGQAMRITTEFIAGLAVGAALGYGADRVLGTSPWCLILFFLLGFAASVLNAFRAAGLGKARQRDNR
jgi:ATP synthase protein I